MCTHAHCEPQPHCHPPTHTHNHTTRTSDSATAPVVAVCRRTLAFASSEVEADVDCRPMAKAEAALIYVCSIAESVIAPALVYSWPLPPNSVRDDASPGSITCERKKIKQSKTQQQAKHSVSLVHALQFLTKPNCNLPRHCPPLPVASVQLWTEPRRHHPLSPRYCLTASV